MRLCPLVTVLAAIVVASAARVAAAAPPQTQPQDPAKAGALVHQPGSHELLPDVSVVSAWIAAGPVSEAWTPLPANPTVWAGDTIWLGCEVGISGSVPALGFKMDWTIDGQKTCGEGIDSLQNPPACEWTYPTTIGHKVIMSYVPHAAGNHTYRCAVDIAGQVAERNESNNSSAELPFKVVQKLNASSAVGKISVQAPKTGPRLHAP